MKEPAESVLGLLSPMAAEPFKAPYRMDDSILLAWDCRLLLFAFAFVFVMNPVNWDWLS